MSQYKIGFVQACWHKEIVDELKFAFEENVKELLDTPPAIDYWEVPGSVEIPLQLKLCAEHGQFDVLVAAGMIVNGGIYRHEFVANAVLRSVMELQLASKTPIIYAVLTPRNFHGEEHERYFSEHFEIKGKEAAEACAKTLRNMERVKHLAATR